MKKRGIWLLLGLLAFGSGVCFGQEEENSDYQYALIEAIKQKNLGNLPEAVKLYRLVIREKPECAAAHYELGGIYLMTKQVEMACGSLEKAFELDRENKWYTIAYLNALGAGEQYDTMEVILEEKIKNDPGEVEWEYQMATVYFSQGKDKKAIKSLENIEKKRGFSEKVTLYKASIYEHEEKYKKARLELEKVMVLFPEVTQFRIAAAELCLKSGLDKEAAAYYIEVLEVDSTNIYALTNLADYYKEREDYRNSFKYMEKSFRNNHIDVRRKISTIYGYFSEEFFMINFKNELGSLVTALIETHPEEMDARLMASDFYIQSKAYDKAYWQVKVYLEEKGGGYPLYMQAVLLANAGSLNEELVHMTGRVLKSYPDSADSRFFRGIGYYELGMYEEMIHNFDSVSVEDFSNVEYTKQAQMLIAEAYYRTNDFQRSDSLFEKLIVEDPDNYMLLNNYSYYLAERKEKLKKAETWSKEAIQNNPDNATFLDTYAWVLFKLEKFEKAEEYIMKAMEKGGENDPEINEHAGDIQVALNSITLAKSYYLKAIILGGDRTKLEDKIDSLNEGNGQ